MPVRTLKLGLNDAEPFGLLYKFIFESLDIEKLRESLEVLLDGDFWPLRGRLGAMEIVVDDGADAMIWEVMDRRDDLGAADVEDAVALAHALTLRPLLLGDPVLCVRATRLRGGAVLLGVNLSHAYADAHTFFRLFWASWARVYSGARPVPVINDRSVFFAPDGDAEAGSSAERSPNFIVSSVSAIFPPPQPTSTSPGRRVLHVPASTLTALKGDSGVSTVQLAMALAWKALKRRRLVFPCNVRENPRRWDAPELPFGWAGNALFLHGTAEFPGGAAPLLDLCRSVRRAVEACAMGANARILRQLAREVRDDGDSFITVPIGSSEFVAVTAWTRMEICPEFAGRRPRALWGWPERMPGLLALTDGEPDGVDVHGDDEELVLIEALMREEMNRIS